MAEDKPNGDGEETSSEKTPKQQKREQMKVQVKSAIQAAGSKGCTAAQIAEAAGLEATSENLHDIRAVARTVVSEEDWSRLNREGRNRLYQAIPEAEAQNQLEAANAAAAKEKAKKAEERKAKKAESTSDDDDGDEEEDVDDEDDDEEDDEED